MPGSVSPHPRFVSTAARRKRVSAGLTPGPLCGHGISPKTRKGANASRFQCNPGIDSRRVPGTIIIFPKRGVRQPTTRMSSVCRPHDMSYQPSPPHITTASSPTPFPPEVHHLVSNPLSRPHPSVHIPVAGKLAKGRQETSRRRTGCMTSQSRLHKADVAYTIRGART